LTDPLEAPKATAMLCCDQPCCLSSQARKRRHSFQACGDGVVVSMPLFYAEKSFLHCAAVCNGDHHSVIIFWDIEKGIEKKRLLAHGRGILITDRYHAARVSSDDTLVKVFDLETEKVIELKGHTSRVEKACASGDGKYLAIGGRNTQVKVWNLPDGTERFNANVLGSGFYRMKFVQEGATLAVANIRTVFLDAGSGKIIEKSPAPFGATDVSPNGKMMVYKGEVRIFNEKDGKF